MILIEFNGHEEKDGIIKKALADGHFPMVGACNVLVSANKETALAVFHRTVELAAQKENDDVVIYFCKDAAGRDCLAIFPMTPKAIVLYGVDAEELGAESSNMTPLNRTIQ